MKKGILKVLILLFAFIGGGVIRAECAGYIFRLKPDTMVLLSEADGIATIGEDLYYADNMEDIYDFAPSNSIEKLFPNYQFELFETDFPVTTSDPYFSTQWYLDTIGAVTARTKGITGKDVKIAVIDSGVNVAHPDFDASTFLPGYNCIIGAENKKDVTDKVGHGTMVAGLIAAKSDNETAISGIAHRAKIIPIKITDTNAIDLANLLLGMESAVDSGCDIINMSFGGSISDSDALSEMQAIVNKAEEKGILLIAAVGNTGHTNNVVNYPAAFDNVIGVGAVDKNLERSYFSQTNESVFMVAPGEEIVSLSSSGGVMSGPGTSFSTPIVSAAVALIREVKPSCTISELKTILSGTSVRTDGTEYDIKYGYGVLSITNILQQLDAEIPDFVVSQGSMNAQKRIHFHNNSGRNLSASIFCADYDGKMLQNIGGVKNATLKCGVTDVYTEDGYEKIFFWSPSFKPFTGAYSIE